mgnify:CR=1 FL=1
MHQLSDTVFDTAVWEAALDKSGSVVQMSVVLYGPDAQMVCRPMPASPIAALFEKHGYQSEIVADCVRACLAQPADHRPPVVISAPSGLAAVGVSLVLEGRVVGAVVAGYALATFSESVATRATGAHRGHPVSGPLGRRAEAATGPGAARSSSMEVVAGPRRHLAR